ncbi:alkaline phosphatase [Xylona heveae TC161]|uniref:Alkaline phosphatase n=1 Tax=Xylona heveae (strain CBS 132557 / TC161) TaxID=1328760 RepID=A0A165AFW1_XYLHT|nr:alkaline phosphatase [Xylona heveae TC161]KZF20408.1 alkaline phosphatase [Xylona heveae TC161]
MKCISAVIAAGLANIVTAAPLPVLDVPAALSNILANTHQSNLYTYPTDLTRGIVPKPIHSHNDYWRDVPFYSALSVGAVSVEGDVWLYNDTLYVGHERSALTEERTLQSLYIEPILDTLTRENPVSQFVISPTKNGVYDVAGDQTLFFWVDIKTNGPTTLPYVIQALEPLRAGGWLTSVNETGITWGPVTVIGTGNTPLSHVENVTSRDYFFDANLAKLDSDQSSVTHLISPIASTDFEASIGKVAGSSLNDTQLATLRQQISDAHSKGIAVRYWNTPAWPITTRNGIWKQLIEEGVDLLNADDLAAAAGFSTQSRYW